MPIYEYQCRHCGKHCEFLQKVTDEAIRQCPHCEKEALEKCISAASFHLKGSGWYVTDFKDKPKAAKDTSNSTATDKKTDEKKVKESSQSSKSETKSSDE